MGGYPDFSLTGRTALVTGSVRGLGLEMARGLAGAGARVVLNGRDAGTLDAAAARLRDEGLNVTAAAFDVTEAFSSCFGLVSLKDEDGFGDLASAPGAAA